MFDIANLIADADIRAVLEYCGVKYQFYRGYYKIACPDHKKNLGREDVHLGNCTIDPKTKKYTCHACGGHGDLIDIVRKSLNLPFRDACSVIANVSSGNADIYDMDVTADQAEELREVKNLRPLCEEVGLTGTSGTRPIGKVICEVYTDEEAEAYREDGYEVIKEGYDIVPSKPGEPYDPVRYLVTERVNVSILQLKKEDPEAYRYILSAKVREFRERIEFLELFNEKCVFNPDMYRTFKAFFSEKREKLTQLSRAIL
jgi:hypothetical protein